MRTISDAIDTLRFNAQHLIAEDDKDDALFTLEVARDVMREVADQLALRAPPSGEAGEPVAYCSRKSLQNIRDNPKLYHYLPVNGDSERGKTVALYALPTIKEPTDGK